MQANKSSKRSISLIGMAGAGKSTISNELAKIIDYEIIDSDFFIEKEYGQSLQNILDNKGYLKLREIEEDILLKINFNKIILSTGGSAIYSSKAMNYLMDNSTVFFLDVPFDQIIERVKNFSARGFAKSPNQTIKDAFEERKCLYEKYSHHLINNSSDVDSCVKKILELI
tara:strand:- start:391 stop:900 length:510 start_codon:yes stop_codon:yes gene_type:complete